MSAGRVGYVHIPDMDRFGFAEFYRNFLPESHREALVVDVRYNEGGFVSELVLDKLTRKPLARNIGRYTAPETYPAYAPRGPMAMLINEQTSSDGDIIAKAFKSLQLGALIGTRTWGGVVGIGGDPESELIDGGEVAFPNSNTDFMDGQLPIENNGVMPTIPIENTPTDYNNGRDSQLIAAVENLMAQLAPSSTDCSQLLE